MATERLTLHLPPGYTYKATWKDKRTTAPVDLEGGHTLWEVPNLLPIKLDDVEMAPETVMKVWFVQASPEVAWQHDAYADVSDMGLMAFIVCA